MAPTLRLSSFSCPQPLCKTIDGLVSALHDIPTKTLPPSPADLRVRQAVTTVTVTSNSGGGDNSTTQLSAGAIAGIVIGSIVGFCLLLWIFRSCMNLGAPPQEPRQQNWTHDPEPRRSHSAHRQHRHHSRRSSHSQGPAVVAMPTTTPVVIRDDRRRSRDHGSKSPRRPEGAYVYDSRGRVRDGRQYYRSY